MNRRATTKVSITRTRRLLRWGSNLCLVTGVIALAFFCFVWAEAHLFQAYENRRFNSGATPATTRAHLEHRNRAPEKLASPGQFVKDNSVIGKLEINRLVISVIVIQGVGSHALRIAAGHVPETALPGQAGNVAIAAHRDTFFRPLRNIRADDIITLVTSHGSYQYKVERISVVRPSRIDVLNPTRHPSLTLITCYPFYYIGSAPLRFIVRARQIAPAVSGRNL